MQNIFSQNDFTNINILPQFYEDLELKVDDPQCVLELELLFNQKITSFENFDIFSNLREVNIMSPLCENFSLNKIESLGERLITLRLVNCNLVEIDKHLTKLKFLSSLSLGENKIKLIRNLHNCIELKSLFLYSNQISKIEYLQDCTSLEEIDLSDNQIEKVENLDALRKLKNLNLSANRIEFLTNINNIKYISSLKEVKFNDENFWPNPICDKFKNYIDYVHALNPEINIIDTFYINTCKEKEDSFIKFIRKFHKYKLTYSAELNKLKKEEGKFYNYANSRDEKTDRLKLNYDKENNTVLSNLQNLNCLFTDKGLNSTVEYFMDDLKQLESKCNQTKLSFAQENERKINFIKKYANIMNSFLNVNKLNDTFNTECLNVSFLDHDKIYEFYKHLFPSYFIENINAVPLIILLLNSNINMEISYIDFCSYEISVVKSEEAIASIYQNISNKNKFKLFEIKEYIQELNSKEDFALLFTLRGTNIYLMFFFQIIDGIETITDHDSSSKINMLSSVIQEEKTLDEILKIREEYREEELLDEQIKQKENSLKFLSHETDELICSIINSLN